MVHPLESMKLDNSSAATNITARIINEKPSPTPCENSIRGWGMDPFESKTPKHWIQKICLDIDPALG
jgi:hypothetical protein